MESENAKPTKKVNKGQNRRSTVALNEKILYDLFCYDNTRFDWPLVVCIYSDVDLLFDFYWDVLQPQAIAFTTDGLYQYAKVSIYGYFVYICRFHYNFYIGLVCQIL